MNKLRISFAKLFDRIKNHLLIICLSIIFTVIFTWPFVTKLSTFYIDSADYSENASKLFYNQLSIKNGTIFSKKYFDGYQYYPQSYSLVYADTLLFPSIIFTPIYWITNQIIFSVNAIFIISFSLSFIFSYYFLYYFTQNKYASIIGAIIYSFNPQIFSHFPTHLNLLSNYFLPLLFLSCYIFISKPTFKNSLLFGIVFTLNSLTAIYFALFSIIILPVFAIPFLAYKLFKKNTKYFLNLLKTSSILLLFSPILFHFNVPYLEFSKNEIATRTLQQTFFFSGRLINWFFTNPDNMLYGNFVKSFEKIRSPGPDLGGIFNYSEFTLSLNMLPFILFLLGIIYFCKNFKKKNHNNPVLRLIFIAFILVLITSFIFSLGAYFFGWNGKGPYWKLPYYYFYQLSPLFQATRALNRYQFIFYIPFTLFAAYGISRIFKKITTKYLALSLFILLIGLLFLENYNLRSYSQKTVTLANIKQKTLDFKFLNNKTILHIPIHIPELEKGAEYTLAWYLLTKAKSLNGYTGYISLEQLSFLEKMGKNLNEDSLKDLFAINTDYVMIHKELLNKNELEIYNQNKSLYEEGEIYNKNNIVIIDLKKYNFTFRKCDFDKNFDKKLELATIENANLNSFVLVLTNKSDCYLPNIYLDKYKKESFPTRTLYGNFINRTVYFKLPVLIQPFEKVTLMEANNQLRIE